MYKDGEREEAGASQGPAGVLLMSLPANQTSHRILAFVFFVNKKKLGFLFFSPVKEQTDLHIIRQHPVNNLRHSGQWFLLF